MTIGTSDTTTMRISTTSMCSRTNVTLPRKNPSTVTPHAHSTPPMAVYPMNFFTSMPAMPATSVTNVRTIGTKRARMIVIPPKRSKNALVRSTFFTLNRPDSLRSNTAGPPLCPMR